MGILDNFEKGLERVVNGAFAKTFKSGLQPLEVTAALRRELDSLAALGVTHVLTAPGQRRLDDWLASVDALWGVFSGYREGSS